MVIREDGNWSITGEYWSISGLIQYSQPPKVSCPIVKTTMKNYLAVDKIMSKYYEGPKGYSQLDLALSKLKKIGVEIEYPKIKRGC